MAEVKALPRRLRVVKSGGKSRPSGVGEAPAGWNAAQCALWDEIAAAAPRGVLTAADRVLVEVCVRNLAQLRALPELTVAQSAELRKCLAEVGMTPGGRRRVEAQGDGLDEF